MIDFGKAAEWQSCMKRGKICRPAGKRKHLAHDDQLYQQCARCGRWVPVE